MREIHDDSSLTGGADTGRGFERWKRAARAAFPYSVPIMTGYVILGFGFGLLLQSKGFGILWALAMSIFIYAGSAQYVSVDLLASGAGLISTAIVILMVNARHLFYGVSMLVRYRNMGKAKPFLIYGLTDEAFSVVSHVDPPEGVDRRAFYLVFTEMCHVYWIIGSVAGAAFGTLVHINTTGVEFSMTALFTVIVVDNLLQKGKRLTSLIGIGCSLICLFAFGPNNFLIPSMASIAIVLMLFRGKLERALMSGEEDGADGAKPGPQADAAGAEAPSGEEKPDEEEVDA